VLMRNKKNNGPVVSCKISLLGFLLFFSSMVQAQHDSSVLADSLSPEILEAPAEDLPADASSTDNIKNDYFLKKQDFREDSSIVQRQVPDSLLKKMYQDDDFWYANSVIVEKDKPKYKEQDYTPLGQQKWVQTLLWLVIVGGFAAVIMWYLAGSNVGLFRKKNKHIPTTGEGELVTEDIFAINYQREIDKAESGNNYRLAIRLMFLRLLKDMAEKNIIQYKQDRTNLDYLLQLHPTVYYNTFFRITRSYEYSWYGQFDVREEAYRIIRNDFKHFDRQIQ